MTETDTLIKLDDAYKSNNIEEFESILRSTKINACSAAISMMISEEYTFLRAVLQHPYTILDVSDGVFYLENWDDERIVEPLFDRIPDKDKDNKEAVRQLVEAAAHPMFEKPKMVSETLRLLLLLKDHPPRAENLSELLVDLLTSQVRHHLKDDYNPITYIQAFVDAGIDMSSLPGVLPEYLYYAHKVHPGITDELMKFGVQKSTAYVQKFMNSARYRYRLTML